MQRSISEKLFLIFFFPFVLGMYLIYKYPLWFVSESEVVSTFYWFGKSTSFWYNTLYTGIVCWIAGKIVLSKKNPYGKGKKKNLSNYQRNKFISIFLSQLILFYLLPFIIPGLSQEGGFFNDIYKPVGKDAYVYVYNGFTSIGGAVYIFFLVPLSVWFFGKRYCSWFCACGNLAETIGTTVWGAKWVKQYTPRGKTAEKLEWIQYALFIFALGFGALLLFDSYKIFVAPNLMQALWAFQHLVVDLAFGALIGVGAYPIWGTRVWCRYGCPLAGMMKIFGKYSKTKFQVEANEACKGLNLCTQVCPMGIDVASYAHENKKPKLGSFGLEETPCIGCGGCIDVCPVDALSFKPIKG